MGISERKQREKEVLKEKILAAATDLFLQVGVEKTSIRMIADRIEYSPATIYLHFKDKNEIFYMIMERAFGLFFQYLSKVMTIADPLERMKELGRVYMRFALENEAYYDLMFISKTPLESHHNDEESFESGKRSHDVLTSTVQQCMDAGHFQGHDAEALSLMIWSTVHGLASFQIRGRMDMYPEERQDELVNEAVESLGLIMNKL